MPPSLTTEDNNPSFVIVSQEDCELSGDREEVFQKLEQDLVSQIRVSIEEVLNTYKTDFLIL